MSEDTVKSLITPQDLTVRTVFNATRSYFIDIYQREYKWTEKQVLTLLNDIELRFSRNQMTRSTPQEISKDVLTHFEPYFLNTFLTHSTATHTAIVDGQQRLTSLLLILIKLYRMLVKTESLVETKGKAFSSKILERLIFETTDSGEAGRFKIYNENRESAFRALVEGRKVESNDETSRRIQENYRTISKWLNGFLRLKDGPDVDLAKATYFITYLLDRISIVEIRIERQQNVATIFEVVNDRGLGLKPYEILKGKLIGDLSEEQKELANRVWSDLQDRYFAAEIKNSSEKSIDLDMFFRTFFRAKFADSETEYERFDGEYHYEMYRNPKILDYFARFTNRDVLFSRITRDLKYFADLYLRVRTSYENEYVLFNKLLDQNQQYLLILSSIDCNDPQESEKIDAVAYKFDQMHTVLRLLDVYESAEFQRLIYPVSANIRGAEIATIKRTFESTLLDALANKELVANGQYSSTSELFEYERFKGVSNRWLNFSKYVLLRIDLYLAKLLDKPSYVSSDLEEIEQRFNRNSTRRYGMHLEHILTRHKKNLALFESNGVLDEAKFQQTRNLLGMVLLLKDKQNISSNDDLYHDKVVTYAKSNLVWNELLAGHLDGVDAKNIPVELGDVRIAPTRSGQFPLESVTNRQKALFEMIKLIWG